MSDLAGFLLARIAEDEADARRAASFKYDVPSDAPWERARARMLTSYEPHQARWSPARVLAECEAKRRMVDVHAEHHGSCSICADGACSADGFAWPDRVPFPCETLQLLALPYADHADFRDEWRAE